MCKCTADVRVVETLEIGTAQAWPGPFGWYFTPQAPLLRPMQVGTDRGCHARWRLVR